MKFLLTFFLSFFVFTTLPVIAQAETVPPASEVSSPLDTINVEELTPEELAQRQKEAEQVCAACGGGLIFVLIAAIALNIALLVWVARDAKNRAMDNSVLWMLLVMFTGIIGLIIYIFSRPQGPLVQCGSCNGKRLSVSAKCPHCQND